MGSLQFTKATKQRRGKPGKVDASLSKKLQEVKWGEFKIGDLFDKIRTKSLRYKTSELPSKATKEFILPALTAGIQNQGLNNFVPKDNATILKNVISISANGANTGATFYQNKEFTILQDAYAIRWKFTDNLLTDNHYLYLTASISKVIFGNYEWTNKAGWERIKTEKIQLPIKNDKIDFDFMENFIAELEAERIAELEAYLSVTGLKDYTLTKEEQQALDDFESDQIKFGKYAYSTIFNKIIQGRRLKKDDQISGKIPFVMAGITNTGVINYISNPVAIFPRNSITIDIFGNTFYRNYTFGAGDDTGVYWNDNVNYSKNIMLYLTASIRKSLVGKFSYGKKLRSSRSLNFKILLPIQSNIPNYQAMETFISAIQKLVIKDVVLYANKKIAATKMVVQSENNKN
nr:restriction endonuclease subunit S [Gilliamella apicola]